MRHASNDDVIADVRARLSLIEGHAAEPLPVTPAGPADYAARHIPALSFGEADPDGFRHPSAARGSGTDPALNALYASVAAVYSETTLRPASAPRTAPPPATPIAMAARSRDRDWSEEHSAAHTALVDPEADFSPYQMLSGVPARSAIFPHEMPQAPEALQGPAASDAALELFSQRLQGLEEKLEAVLARAAESAPSDDILDRMDELKGQYQRVANEIARLEVIEDNLARLIDEVAGRQPDNGLLADSVAQRVMREMAEQGLGGPAADHDAERFAGLEQTLTSYVNSRQAKDHDTHSLLKSIRGLVEQLDSRVGVIEHEIQQATAAEPEPEYAAPSQVQHAAVAYEAEAPAAFEEAAATGQEGGIEDSDYDNEMAAAEPAAPTPQTPTRDHLGQPAPMSSSEPRARSDREAMIASARRAARAAAAPAGNPVRAKMVTATPEQVKPKAAVSNRAARFSLDKQRPRPVIIMAALAAIVIASGLLYMKMTRKPAGPRITIEQSVAPAEGQANQTKKKAKEAPAEGEDKQSMLDGTMPDLDSELEAGSTDSDVTLAPTRASTDTSIAAESDVVGTVSDDLPPEGIAPLATRIKAANGDPLAQHEIATQFARGAQAEPDLAKAAEWYERAATAGHAPSAYQLAALLERGSGVPQDAKQARLWYGRAVAAGNVKAMHNLAVMLTTEDGGPRDYAASAKLFRQAAEHGLADSQFNLAILYENGLGVKRSTGEAYRWFALASEAGDKEAVRRRDAVRRRQSPSTIERLDGEIKTWSPTPVDEAANSVPAMQTAAAVEAPAMPAPAEPVQPKKADILLVQDLLKVLGYQVGAPGVLDAQTSEAVASFQQRSKMPVTGEISDALITKLVSLAG